MTPALATAPAGPSQAPSVAWPDAPPPPGVQVPAVAWSAAPPPPGVQVPGVAWPDAPQHLDVAVRRDARALHAACAELLPGYAAAKREPWRQALLTAGCLGGPWRRAAGRRSAPALIVEDVVQPSDVLCALLLARRSGLFCPGSSCGDTIGLRSACDIVPAFAAGMARERRDAVLAALRANAAWRAHRAARESNASVDGGH